MTRTTIFMSNRSQAVRLPRDVAFPSAVREVVILREGTRRIIVPANAAWDDFFASRGIDIERGDQPVQAERAAL